MAPGGTRTSAAGGAPVGGGPASTTPPTVGAPPTEGTPVALVPVGASAVGPPAPNITAPNATLPNATAPNATAPNITAPSGMLPNATIPNATAPSTTLPTNATTGTAAGPQPPATNAPQPQGGNVTVVAPGTSVNKTGGWMRPCVRQSNRAAYVRTPAPVSPYICLEGAGIQEMCALHASMLELLCCHCQAGCPFAVTSWLHPSYRAPQRKASAS